MSGGPIQQSCKHVSLETCARCILHHFQSSKSLVTRGVHSSARERRPPADNTNLVLNHRLLLLPPEAKVELGARRKLRCAWRVGQAKDGLVVRVLENALGLAGPDDDGVVSPS